MEVIFDNVNFKSKNPLINLNFSIKDGSIVGLIVNDFSAMYELISLNKRPNSGTIKIGDLVIKRTNSLKDRDVIKNRVGYVRNVVNLDYLGQTVEEEISKSMEIHNYSSKDNLKHIKDSLIIAGLNEEFLDRDPKTLSYTEKKKLEFAKVIAYNPDILIVEDFDKDFIARDRDYFKKILKKLRIKFKKTIILLALNVEVFFDIVDEVFVIQDGTVVLSGQKEIFYNEKLYEYVEMPKIVEFTKYVNDKGHNVLEYVDLKELIKELYRKIK